MPDDYYSVLLRYPGTQFGESEFRSLGAELYTMRWHLDGVWLDSQADEIKVVFADGQEHTMIAEMTLKTTGQVYRSKATWRAPVPMSVTAPLQSARIARKRGILVHVTGVSGFYRASTKSKTIPGSGNARIRVPEPDSRRLSEHAPGRASIRIRGKYLERIRPGQKIKVEARHLKGSYALERATATVRLR